MRGRDVRVPEREERVLAGCLYFVVDDALVDDLDRDNLARLQTHSALHLAVPAAAAQTARVNQCKSNASEERLSEGSQADALRERVGLLALAARADVGKPQRALGKVTGRHGCIMLTRTQGGPSARDS